ncbi:phosphate acetyltransferase [Enterobacteriaceae endosymbiont of Plateumaris consimilis]|uniref:phosphate acetyltransferase n=1 Tax=Enterobacteriaceae endosymbiont of Plateumaris consimilis TaxID=2675794 RepID=UPI00144A16E0|nr:phosphate acetyltransferase [Enterobacteriaceae endosymbiont of Plateumaris consimilis]QJC28485.1 phosphate acetyltransferase [Enterobacteriaceae endosymbiont of Plateumaris consimilis]
MSKIIMSIPVNIDVNFFTSVNLGLIHNLQMQHLTCKFFKPISHIENNVFDYTKKILMKYSNIECIKSLNIKILNKNIKYNNILDNIIKNYYLNTIKTDIILIEGLIPIYTEQKLLFSLNCEIAKIFNADIIFITSMLKTNNFEQIKSKINFYFKNFVNNKQLYNAHYIIRKSFKKNYNPFFYCYNLLQNNNTEKLITNNISNILKLNTSFIYIPWGNISNIFKINIIEICQYLNCNIINIVNNCEIKSTIFINNDFIYKQYFFETLIILSIKNINLLKKLYKKIINGSIITAILFTDYEIVNIIKYNIINDFINLSIKNKITLLNINLNIWEIYSQLQNFNKNYFPIKDKLLINKIKNYTSKYINKIILYKNIKNYTNNDYISPYIFKYNIIKQAQEINKSILLPEGNELRIIQAASICVNQKIANCILLGNIKEIESIAKLHNIILNKKINIIDPNHIRKNYIQSVIKIRKHKGIDESTAENLLKNDMFLATIMLKLGEVDGIVSGARHTTANTIRPALQIIKTLPQYSLISSIFLMLLNQGVLIYGDCAINPNPNAKQLAEIAIQSAESAKLFNIKPKIAMVSYSTGNSSTGQDVDLVFKATKIIQNKYPNLVVDGPLQYDAAIIKNVAKYKSPHSLVAGKANIIIFPDLNTGNITYKAVQRSSETISIGPILQGINKPVNDLSRGATTEDIIYTIVITSIQSIKKL